MTIKTAISLEESLFEKVESLARKLKVSRSQVFARAVTEYVARQENRRLLDAINAVYSEPPEPEEVALQQKIREQHRRMVKGQW